MFPSRFRDLLHFCRRHVCLILIWIRLKWLKILRIMRCLCGSPWNRWGASIQKDTTRYILRQFLHHVFLLGFGRWLENTGAHIRRVIYGNRLNGEALLSYQRVISGFSSYSRTASSLRFSLRKHVRNDWLESLPVVCLNLLVRAESFWFKAWNLYLRMSLLLDMTITINRVLILLLKILTSLCVMNVLNPLSQGIPLVIEQFIGWETSERHFRYKRINQSSYDVYETKVA